jgi:methylmalonyl-CoA mutase, N-terminal domain
VVVGVNRFTDESVPLEIETPDFSSLEQQQRSRLAEVKLRRDSSRVQPALGALGAAARGNGRLMPPIIEAVKARATLGEISDTLRSVWGVYRPV